MGQTLQQKLTMLVNVHHLSVLKPYLFLLLSLSLSLSLSTNQHEIVYITLNIQPYIKREFEFTNKLNLAFKLSDTPFCISTVKLAFAQKRKDLFSI